MKAFFCTTLSVIACAGLLVLGCDDDSPDMEDNDASTGDTAPSTGDTVLEDAGAFGMDCARSSRAVGHHPGARAVETERNDAPFMCSISTSIPSAPDTVIVTGDHDELLLSPAPGNALLRSLDGGETWENMDPPIGDEKPALRIHPWLWRDEATGRVFYNAFDTINGQPECGSASGTPVCHSDDLGDSWTCTTVGCDGSKDFGKVFTGPPARSETMQTLAAGGYESVVYFCVEGPVLYVGFNRYCYRSLDGGLTFTRTAGDAIDNTNKGQTGWPLAGAVAPDGTIYIAHTSNEGLAVSISEDEGDSWHDRFVPGSAFAVDPLAIVVTNPNAEDPIINFLSSNVATDSDGNVYVTWVDDADLLPYLAVSKDKGQTWTGPMMIGAAGVRVAVMPNLLVAAPGYVAVAYYASAQSEHGGGDGYLTSDGRKYNAYLTACRDAFAADPVLWTAQINDASEPVINGMSVPTGGEYIGAPALAQDGKIWAAFADATGGQVLAVSMTPPPG